MKCSTLNPLLWALGSIDVRLAAECPSTDTEEHSTLDTNGPRHKFTRFSIVRQFGFSFTAFSQSVLFRAAVHDLLCINKIIHQYK